MNNPSTCPDITVLSQVLDHESSLQEEHAVTQHLATCANCRTLIARLQHATERGRTIWTHVSSSPALTVHTSSCLSPETIATYVQRLLPEHDNRRAEEHLQTCNACVNEVQNASRITALFSPSANKPVPAGLQTQVAALWQPASGRETRAATSRVVIQLAEKGLRLLEQNLIAPFFNIQEMLVPAPAYRSEEAPTRLDLKLMAGQHTIALTLVPDGKGVALTLTLLGPQQENLAGQRVSLNQQAKLILSKKTDQQGVLRVPHLSPGVYEIECAGLGASFEVELHV